MTFEQMREFSKRYEIAFSDFLQSRDYFVLPTYDYSGLGDSKAPMLQGKQSLILPDLLAYKDGVSTWYEIKVKTRADYHRKTQHYVTGINKRHYEHYLQVKTVTKSPVWIVFIHLEEKETRVCEISSPYHHVYDDRKMGRNGMVFFDYQKLKRVDALLDYTR